MTVRTAPLDPQRYRSVGRPQRVLVTGDHGYVGSVLVPLLRAAGHDVTGLDAGWYDGCDLGPLPTGYRHLTGDVRDVTPYHLTGFDAVVHLAGISNDPVGDLDPDATLSVNVDGAVHLAEAARAAGVPRFLLASSCAVYGASGDAPASEDARPRPCTAYGRSLVQAEAGIAALAGRTFSPTFLRGGTVYGSSPRWRADIVLNDFVGAAVLRGRVELRSDGRAWRPLIHVQDLCAAFLTVLDTPRATLHGTVLNVGLDEDTHRIEDLALVVSRRLGVPIEAAPGAPADRRDYRVDFSRIRRLLPSYRPRWTVTAGIDELAGDLRRHGVTREDLGGPRYVRLERVRRLVASGRMRPGMRAEILAV
ncbi:MAG TPA: SDR family oxidoreductase [Nocardioides sp.]|nr:SDR family oxidoreductase [Nocardioides sp.]